MSLGLGLGFKLKGYKLGLAIPKNLRITSTTATTISYAWDASAGVDGYQFGIYQDAACTVLIDLITIYGASTTTYTWTIHDHLVEGGIITYDGDYQINTFLTGGTLKVYAPITAEFLLVAGGGAGGYSNGGGGGAGGLIHNIAYNVVNGSFTITIGAGGVSSNGSNSIFDIYTAIGGGKGGDENNNGSNGGSGGGAGGSATNNKLGGLRAAGQGSDGGDGIGLTPNFYIGSGGGAQSKPTTKDGANGLQLSISGIATYYAGGGGSGGDYPYSSNLGLGGLGGGGNGSNTISSSGQNGIANTGGGGGGGGNVGNGGNGGSGIFIVRYKYK